MNQSQVSADHWDSKYQQGVRSAWTQNPRVERELYRRMTGEYGFWLEWTFRALVGPQNHVLSIGCGDGSHELAMARLGFTSEIDAFDASPVAIELATAAAVKEGLRIRFAVNTFEHFVDFPGPEDRYDVVLFAGSLHHVADLEGMLTAVQKVLKPSGKVIVNEYCGPCYQLYSDDQVKIVNNVLKAIPEAFRMDLQDWLTLPTIGMVMANDPTEGVRSALIPHLLPMYFKADYTRPMGGALLHPIFGHLNSTKVNDGSPESNVLVDMLIALENELTQTGALDHDFMFGIYSQL